MWFRFTADFDFRPSARPTVTIAYKSGMVANVTRECAKAAKSAGAGNQVKASKGGDDGKQANSRDA